MTKCIPKSKTTIEISNDRATTAKTRAAKRNMTLGSLIEFGLPLELRAVESPKTFRLRNAAVGGRGLNPAYCDADRPRIPDAIYEGRGG